MKSKFLAVTQDFTPVAASSYAWIFGFHGQFIDTESGLMNYGYRYYSPNLGRWLCKDPIDIFGGPNLYCFADDDPTSRIDRLGLSPITPLGTPGSGLQTESFNQLMQRNNLSSDQQTAVKKGCIGICSCAQNPNPAGPFGTPTAIQCYMDETSANAAAVKSCPSGTVPFLFAKQGNWSDFYGPGGPNVPPGQPIGTGAVVSGAAAGTYNYVTRYGTSGDCNSGPPYRYGWAVGQPTDDQLNDTTLVKYGDQGQIPNPYPACMWCYSCKPCKNAQQ